MNGIFFSSDDVEDHESIMRDMYKEYDPSEPEKYLLDSWWKDSSEYWGIDVEYEEMIKDRWESFKDEIMYKNRFFPQNKFDLASYKKTIAYLENKEFKMNYTFFRARRGELKFDTFDMGKPTRTLATSGRANPMGIPYLYLASDIETALAEMRPILNEFLTVGQFILTQDTKLIDLRHIKIDSPFNYGKGLRNFLSDLYMLKTLGIELSKPVTPTATLEYLPTQYICEYIKQLDYDGILYQSSANKKGFNMVLFDDVNKVECTETHFYQIYDNDFKYREKLTL